MRSSIQHFTGLAGLACCLALAACKSASEEQMLPPVAGGVHGYASDPFIERQLTTTIVSTREVDGLKVVELELRNRADKDIVVAWSIEWFDRNGRPIPASASSTWRRTRLEAGGVLPVEIRATSPAADSWRLRAVDPQSLK